MSVSCAAFSPECHGRLEFHHAVRQQRIKREFPHGAWRARSGAFKRQQAWHPIPRSTLLSDIAIDPEFAALSDILGDTRNRIWLCQAHHERLHNKRFELELPESVLEFAAEFGFTAALENDARRAA